ncbi:transposase InsO family protein [Bradyrhizobium sp. USDA 3650]
MTRECLAAIPDTPIPGRRVARELTALINQRGKPGMIVSDNGTEFTCNAMLAWSKENNIDWHFIAPGKPMQNGFCESFNADSDEVAQAYRYEVARGFRDDVAHFPI